MKEAWKPSVGLLSKDFKSLVFPCVIKAVMLKSENFNTTARALRCQDQTNGKRPRATTKTNKGAINRNQKQQCAAAGTGEGRGVEADGHRRKTAGRPIRRRKECSRREGKRDAVIMSG